MTSTGACTMVLPRGGRQPDPARGATRCSERERAAMNGTHRSRWIPDVSTRWPRSVVEHLALRQPELLRRESAFVKQCLQASELLDDVGLRRCSSGGGRLLLLPSRLVQAVLETDTAEHHRRTSERSEHDPATVSGRRVHASPGPGDHRTPPCIVGRILTQVDVQLGGRSSRRTGGSSS